MLLWPPENMENTGIGMIQIYFILVPLEIKFATHYFPIFKANSLKLFISKAKKTAQVKRKIFLRLSGGMKNQVLACQLIRCCHLKKSNQ